MKYVKRLLCLACFLLVVLSSFVEASMGVSPAKYDVNFEPGFEDDFYFNFHTDNPSQELEIYIWGELGIYITLNKDKIVGSGKVDVHLKLPQKIETPGRHRIFVGARPVVSETSGTVSILASVAAAIDVYVPYPGKYAEIKFEAENANAGEEVPYKLEIYSRGEEAITTNSRIEIFDSRNESVGIYELGTKEIIGVDSVTIRDSLDTITFGAGNYKAVAVVTTDGGQEVKAEDNFKLGELRVRIINYTRELKKNTINPFVIDVESLWNDPVDELYAEVFVLGAEEEISFLTPSAELKPWQRAKLSGYFDTTGLEVGEEVQVRIVLHYGEETTEEVVYLRFVKTVNYFLIVSIIAGAIAVIAFVMWLVVKFKKSEGKSGEENK
ncbi:MAG: hypothetical protein KJ718_06085 [Nanoarchaeota archaeon]|nr:hypothetical protein [Nanoarchaeota archaeon]MBU1052091.1 hypothetical protein [Nanoarchaeota archaeon]MBU1988477.1 hypothetical protein [Nanoarchaeota archaeon]